MNTSTDWNRHFVLTADINRQGISLLPVGDYNQHCTGVFDGNGHTISHLTITGGDGVGLFGRLESGAVVKNLGVVDINITGSSEHVGALAGYNSGSVTQCYNSTGAVSVTGQYVGGLVGNNYGSIDSSLWDTQTSGQSTSAGGKGKTTAEMQTATTFVDAGWDFVAESQKGTEDIWAICEGADYPHLAWEFVVGDFDADADTDFGDFCILAEHWLADDGSFWCGQGCDLTNDGSVNWQDLMVFAENWLTAMAP